MNPAPDLSALTHAEKDALILALFDRLAAAEARIAELTRPPKTPGNSSKPPSQGQKPNAPPAAAKPPPPKGRPGTGRALHPNPDRVVDSKLAACPACAAAFPEAAQAPQQVYERIEVPPVRPDVTQVRLFGGCCPCCGKRATAPAPAGLEPGSPFGATIAATVTYLHYAHAIGMERLALLMREMFGLSISEGGISNILSRAREPLQGAAQAIEKVVLASPVVCSDETSVRVKGKTWWEVRRTPSGTSVRFAARRVFVGRRAALHLIKPSRGKAVVTDLFGASRPEVWVSDMLGAQRGHGGKWQVCLAHLLRDAQYAIEDGDTAFAAPFRLLLLRAMAIGKRRDSLKDATLKQYLDDLDRRLDRIMAAEPAGEAGRRLHKRMRLHRGSLFVFVTRRDVPYTNNVSERHLRPSTIFRKVTNGFRCEWGAEAYAAFRSVVSTAKANGASVLDTVRFVLSAPKPSEAVPGAGEQLLHRKYNYGQVPIGICFTQHVPGLRKVRLEPSHDIERRQIS